MFFAFIFAPDDIWSKYIRYIGAGAVAFAGIVTVIVSIPTMYRAFMAVSRGIGKHIGERNSAPVVVERTDRDVPPTFIIAGILFVVCVAALVPGIFSGDLHFGARLVCACLLYTSPSPRDRQKSRMPSSA